MGKRLSTKRRISRFNKILKDIKDVKIQGATAIAESAIKAYVSNPSKESAKKILATRPTEPLMQNALRSLQKSKFPKKTAQKYLNYMKKSKEIIARRGASLIRNDMNVYSHCHSSTVIEILKYAKKKRKKRFVVYTTEVEPLLQGRQTARELARAGIKVVIFPDLAVEQAIKKCDIFLFGVDAYLKKGVVNKVGTSTLCKLAKEKQIPRYCCGASFKFTKRVKIEKRKAEEVWDERQKNIDVINPAFDFTNKKLLSGVISEFGILPFGEFIKRAKSKLKKFK